MGDGTATLKEGIHQFLTGIQSVVHTRRVAMKFMLKDKRKFNYVMLALLIAAVVITILNYAL
jgi:hypothetical protein